MSTEATGNGRRDAVDQAGQATAAGPDAQAGEIPVADVAAGSGPPSETGESDATGETRETPTEVIDFAEPAELSAGLAEPAELAEPLRPRRWSRALIVAGFVILAVAIVGGAVAIVASATHGFKKPVHVTYKKAAVFSLKAGDCFDPRGQSYKLVSCNAPHSAEVFATFALSGTGYPGGSAASAAAGNGCASRLTGYLNPQLSVSLASTFVYPDATAWQAGTRTVICEVRATSGSLTGSVRGASATAG
jgi:Septum formation